MSHYGYGPEDIILCSDCGTVAVDIHHVVHKSQGGSDEVDNLIAVCRPCHESYHLLNRK